MALRPPAKPSSKLDTVTLSKSEQAQIAAGYERGQSWEDPEGSRLKLKLPLPDRRLSAFSGNKRRALVREFERLLRAYDKLSPDAVWMANFYMGLEHFPETAPPLRGQVEAIVENLRQQYPPSNRSGRPLRLAVLEAAFEFLAVWAQRGFEIELGAKFNHSSTLGEYRFSPMVRALGLQLLAIGWDGTARKAKDALERTRDEEANLVAWTAIGWLIKNGALRKLGVEKA